MFDRRSFLLSAFVTASLAGCKRDAGTEGRSILIGGAVPLTGDAATFGINASRGAELAVEAFAPQSDTYNFSWKTEDTQGQPLEATAAARKLIDLDGAKAIIGGVTSSGTHAMITVAESAKVPILSPSASDPALSGSSPFFARLWPSDVYEADVLAEYAASAGFEDVAIIFLNNDYGNGIVKAFRKRFEGNISFQSPYNEGTSEFRPVLARVGNEEPDAMLVVAFPERAKLILTQMKEMSIDLPIMATATIEDSMIATLSNANLVVFASPLPLGPDSKMRNNFIDSYKERYGEEPGVLSDVGYDCAMLIMKGFIKTGGEAVGIIPYITSLENYEGISGVMSFKSDGDVIKRYGLKSGQGGEFVWRQGD